jgi:hypothetical protein
MDYKNKYNFFQTHREETLTALLILICLALLTFFPTYGPLQQVTSGIIFLFAVPMLYLKFVLKKSLPDFGWKLGEWKNGLAFSAIYLVSALLISVLLFRYTSFLKEYQLPVAATRNFWFFVFYELVVVGVFSALYEIFFRGFFMFYISAKTGVYSIFCQFLLFFLFFWTTGNLDWNTLPLLIVALFSGLVTFKSSSLLYSFATSLLFLLIFDSLVIKFTH